MKKEKSNIICKKSACTAGLFLLVLSAPALLCGCASARDEVTAALVNETQAVQQSVCVETADCSMTGMAFSDETPELEGAHESGAPQVYIYICGAVELPGVYSLRQGSRLFEAVELAGGLSADADENCQNMARQITDGEQVVILTQEEAQALREAGTYVCPAGAAAQGMTAQDSGLVNINTATVAELTTVSGIGEGRAQAIVAYREKHGRFDSIEDIKRVDGIKDGLFSKIKDKITI